MKTKSSQTCWKLVTKLDILLWHYKKIDAFKFKNIYGKSCYLLRGISERKQIKIKTILRTILWLRACRRSFSEKGSLVLKWLVNILNNCIVSFHLAVFLNIENAWKMNDSGECTAKVSITYNCQVFFVLNYVYVHWFKVANCSCFMMTSSVTFC